jgi:hypothetical protein
MLSNNSRQGAHGAGLNGQMRKEEQRHTVKPIAANNPQEKPGEHHAPWKFKGQDGETLNLNLLVIEFHLVIPHDMVHD